MTLKGRTRCVKYFSQIYVITRVPFELELPNLADNTQWERICKGSATPFCSGVCLLDRPITKQGCEPQRSTILGVPSICAYAISNRTNKFDVDVSHTGGGFSLGGHSRPTARGGAPAVSNFGVPFCLYAHPLIQNYQI